MEGATDNLYRIDDVLIRTGFVLGLVVLIVLWQSTGNTPMRTWPGEIRVLFGVFVLAPVVLLIAGYRVRRRETRTVELGRVLRVHPSMPVPELCAMTGFSRSQLRDAVNLLNRKSLAGLTFDERTDRVSHVNVGPRAVLTHAQRCGSCGASISVTVEADTRVDELSCTYCNGALDSQAISRLQHQLQTPNAMPQAFFGPAAESAPPKKFSLVLFIVLLMFFWPAAVGYAVMRHKNLPVKF